MVVLCQRKKMKKISIKTDGFDSEQFEGYVDPNDADEVWKALIENLPALDPSGNTYEYILLEKDKQPVYRNEPTESANYRTVIINGPGEGGFNLLIRKSWLDDSDTLHRHPITVTLYNKYTYTYIY